MDYDAKRLKALKDAKTALGKLCWIHFGEGTRPGSKRNDAADRAWDRTIALYRTITRYIEDLEDR